MKADAFEDKKTRENREDFAPNGRFKDISSDWVHDDLMRLTSLDVQEYAESPALSEYISDDALVNQGAKVPMEMRKSTPAGSLQHAGSDSTYKAQGTNFLP